MKKITIYSLSTCVHCKETINYIDQKGLPYICIDIDLLDKSERKKVLTEFTKINPDRTFPTIDIGNSIITGYDISQIEGALTS